MSRSDAANDRAARWLIRQEDGAWSQDDQAEFDAWLAEADGNKAAYWRMRHGWRQADRVRAMPSEAERVAPPRGRASWWIWGAAACLLAAVGGGVLWRFAPEPAPQGGVAQYETRLGGQQHVELVDGSTVDLNTASTVRTRVTNERREVWLDQGEAFFQIRHMEGRPFVVHAGDRVITVLGTKFSVRREGEKVSVKVLQGRVMVSGGADAPNGQSAILTTGGVGVVSGSSILVANASETSVEDGLAWREGLLRFDQARLSDVASEFNRYNARPLKVDPSVADLKVGGAFPTRDPEAFARLLRDAYGLHVEMHEDSVTISN